MITMITSILGWAKGRNRNTRQQTMNRKRKIIVNAADLGARMHSVIAARLCRTTRAGLECGALLLLISLGAQKPHEVVAAAPAENVLAEFPIGREDLLLRVPVTIAGMIYDFDVDTGCRVTMFDSSLAPLLTPTSLRGRIHGQHATRFVQLYRSPEARLDNLRIPSLEPVLCIKQKAHPFLRWKKRGSLGADALKPFIMRVDYDRRRLAFLRSVPSDAGLRLQLTWCAGCPAITGNIGGVVRTFILDTGGNSYCSGMLAKPEFDGMVALGDLSVAETVPAWSDTGKGEHRAGVLLLPFSIGPFQHSGLAFVEGGAGRNENLLTLGYLHRYAITFDFPNSVVYLRPGRQFDRLDATHNPGGLTLRRDRERIVVTSVASAGFVRAARDGGVKPNDVLESVNGTEVKELYDTALSMALSRSDQPLAFVFRRPSDGTRIRLMYDELAARRRATDWLNSSAKQGPEEHWQKGIESRR